MLRHFLISFLNSKSAILFKMWSVSESEHNVESRFFDFEMNKYNSSSQIQWISVNRSRDLDAVQWRNVI